MKTITPTTAPCLFPAAEPQFTPGQRVRLVGVDRYCYRVARRRKITRTWEYLINDMHGRAVAFVYEDRLRAVSDRCFHCGQPITEDERVPYGGGEYACLACDDMLMSRQQT